MKFTLPGVLLLSYAVYTAFVPVNIAHSIILFSLAALYGFENYLLSNKHPSIIQKVEELRQEFQAELVKQKEFNEERLKVVEEEQARQAIVKANSSSASKPKSPAVRF